MTPTDRTDRASVHGDGACLPRLSLAHLGHPHHGGTYTVFRNLRAGLAARNADLRWLGVGPEAWATWNDPDWASERDHGSPVEPAHALSEAELSRRLADRIVADGCDAVLVGVLTREAEMLAVTRLPPGIARIMIVHNITPGTYAAARALRDLVHATVAISPRIARDLVGRHGFPPERCTTIPHGIDVRDTPRTINATRKLRILSLGRIDEAAKGVLWLPPIMRRLGLGDRLTIAGEGPDLARLRLAARDLTDRVQFVGPVAPADVPALLGRHDVLLVPSRYEGFCLTIAEAMAAGCIPVASHIAGVTDAIVADGRDGSLFPVGDVASAVAALDGLRDPLVRARMSHAARARAVADFGIDMMARRYRDLIDDLRRALPPLSAKPLDAMPQSPFRRRLPAPLKNALRLLRERVA